MAERPFRVERSHLSPGMWRLYMRLPNDRRLLGYFGSIAEAHDHAHKNWPWWL